MAKKKNKKSENQGADHESEGLVRNLVINAGAILEELDAQQIRSSDEIDEIENLAEVENLNEAVSTDLHAQIEDHTEGFLVAEPMNDLPVESASEEIGDLEAIEIDKSDTEILAQVNWVVESQGLDFLENESETHGQLNFVENELLADSAESNILPVAEEIESEREVEAQIVAHSSAVDQEDDDFSEEPFANEGEVQFVEYDQLVSIIESLLFSTDKPVSMATIRQMFKGTNIRNKDIKMALEALASEYAGSQRGITLEEIQGGFQLRTKSDNAEFLRRLTKVRPFRLSGPALEVMAIVAYKQPLTKHEIDEIRGVESGHLLRALMERGLVCFNGKSDLPGKPMTYGSTRKFLEIFGLRNLKELPTLREIDDLLPEGIGDEEEKESLSDLTESLSQEMTSSYSEGEDELLKIQNQLQQIDTTTEFFEQEKQREREHKERERAQDIRERLVLGDPVDEKDKRWLDRYEARLHEGTMKSEAADEQIDNHLSEESLLSTEESAAVGEDLMSSSLASDSSVDGELVDLNGETSAAQMAEEEDGQSSSDDDQFSRQLEALTAEHGMSGSLGAEDLSELAESELFLEESAAIVPPDIDKA